MSECVWVRRNVTDLAAEATTRWRWAEIWAEEAEAETGDDGDFGDVCLVEKGRGIKLNI